MKRVSNKFRNSLRGVRRLSAIVGYYTDDSYFILTTEDGKFLQTEDGNNLLTTETGIVEYDEGVINNVNVLFNTSLLKTTCKSVQIDCNNKIEVGTKINVRIGVYIPENDDFEYVNYGDYYIIDEPVYQADTKSYLITAYDKMVQSMVDYDSNPLSITYPITHKNLIKAICSKLGWEEELGTYDCETTEIKENIYSGQGLTYRDILDDLNGAMGGSLMFAIDNQLICKQPTETNLIIEDDDLKDTNVDFGDKYGPVNALTISSNKDVIIDNREDSSSIQENGKTEFKLNDNLLMIKQSDDFIDDLFNKIDGLEYNIFDVSSTGILIIEPLDIFTFRHDGVDYKTIMLNDDIQLSQGLEENLYVEKPEETESEYITNDKNEKKLNNASISVDKANAEVILKADSNGRIVQARLDADADDGSVFEVKADNIKLEGTTTINERFKIDNNGYMYAKAGGEIAGWKIKNTALYKDVRIGDYDYRAYIQSPLTDYTEDSWIFSTQKKHKDSTSYDGTAIIKLGGDISGKNINANGNISSDGNISIGGKLAGYLNLNDAKSHFISEYGMYFTDETFVMQGADKYTQYTHNMCLVNGPGRFNGYVNGWDFYPTSSVKSKKNIKHFNDSALEIIKNTDIYNYNFTNEEKNVKKHIGFVIGDGYTYDERITNNENEGVDLYSFVSVCCKAIQEQQEQIEELKREIENLKGGNK